MTTASIVLSISTALLALMTLAPLTHISHWLVRSLDFPRLQLAFLALLNGAACAFFGLRSGSQLYFFIALGVITGLILLYHCWWIYPYGPWHRAESSSFSERNDSTVGILASNVLMSNPHAEALLKLVDQQRPDLVLTLETNDRWQQQLQILEKEYPYRIACPQSNRYGMHVYSKLEISKSSVEFLVGNDIPSFHFSLRLKSGRNITMHCLHPAPPSPTESSSSSPRDAELIVVARKVAACDGPVIVLGDLNDVAWSRTTLLFRKVSGLLDPRIGRGMYNTFHVEHWYLRWPLDHLFHSMHFHLNAMRRLYLKGSDHFSLYTQLTLTDSVGRNVASQDADAADRALASDMVDEEPVDKSDVPSP